MKQLIKGLTVLCLSAALVGCGADSSSDDKTIKIGASVTPHAEIIENIKGVLESEGLDFANVIKTTCFLSDMSNFASFNEVYSKYFVENPPARSCVAVKQLPKDALVEVEIIAVLN